MGMVHTNLSSSLHCYIMLSRYQNSIMPTCCITFVILLHFFLVNDLAIYSTTILGERKRRNS